MKIFAFSWPPNTGKTTLIKTLEWNFMTLWYNVKVYNEVASSYFDLLPCKDNGLKDITFYQKALNIAECTRIKHLRKDLKEKLYNVILIDRTWYDQEIYYERNLSKSNCEQFDRMYCREDRALYDEVIIFTDPIVSDNWPGQFYDNTEFRSFYNEQIQARYEYSSIWRNSVDFIEKKWFYYLLDIVNG